MENERKFNILRGVVVGSFLDNEQKKELIEFINQLEEQEEEQSHETELHRQH